MTSEHGLEFGELDGGELVEITPMLGWKDGELFQLKKVTRGENVSFRWEFIGEIDDTFPIVR